MGEGDITLTTDGLTREWAIASSGSLLNRVLELVCKTVEEKKI